jgi:hypothetical protein
MFLTFKIRGVNMTNYYNSGLYSDPFFIKHKDNFDLFNDGYLDDEIEFDADLFAKHFNLNSNDLLGTPQNEPSDHAGSLLLQYLPTWPSYFEPLIFTETTALACGLVPFILTPQRLCLVVVSVCNCDFYTRLDAYQALTNKTIDPNSYLFSDFDYFQSLVGKELTEKVLEAISYTITPEIQK